jgi:ATP-dependent helicase HrpA
VILGRVKEILRQRKDFKVIVTSASLDTELFKQYFSAPILKISGRMYPVVEIFKPYDYVKDTKQKV